MSGGAWAYRHTQQAWLPAGGVVALASVACGNVASRASGDPLGVWVMLALTLGLALPVAVVFSALTIEVDEEVLRWHFRLGVFRREVPRAEVAGVEATATTLADGIGVHGWSRRMVYNVALGPAVRVVRRDGRAVVLGTDDPGGLVAALTPPGA